MNSIKVMALGVVCIGWLSVGLAQEATVTAGKKVKMDYTLTVNNQQIETSIGKKPLEFIDGSRMLIPGLEKGIEGMRVGEEKIIAVSPQEAYGEADPKAFKEFPKTSMPANIEPKVGMILRATAPDGRSFPAIISQIKGDTVILDFNHPLAGKQLTFKVKILDIQNAPSAPKVVTPGVNK